MMGHRARPAVPPPAPPPVCLVPACAFADSRSAFVRARMSAVAVASLAVTVTSTPLSTSLSSVFAPVTVFGQCAIFPLGATAPAASEEDDADGAVAVELLAEGVGFGAATVDFVAVGVVSGFGLSSQPAVRSSIAALSMRK
jgi:hypothetical protein